MFIICLYKIFVCIFTPTITKTIIMKANLTKLNNLKEKLEEKLESMEWAMDERSERWHESEAAQIHEDKMNALDGAIMSIQDAIDELSEAFDLQDLF